MNTRVLLLGCLLAFASQVPSATRTEVWVWTDADGVKHYSDYPAPGARKLTLVGNTAQGGAPPPPPVATPSSRPAKPPPTEYTALEILLPENEASFFGTDAVVDIRVRSEPLVAETDHLLVFVDGKQVGEANVYEHTLTDLERGAHQLVAVLSDARGVEKLRSEPRVFYIKQTTLNENPRGVGPALKPKPTPR
jgi:hypothetical protein